MTPTFHRIPSGASDALERLAECARGWGVTIDRTWETTHSALAFGLRGGEPVVLKVGRGSVEEDASGRALEAFDGHGTVRALAHRPGAVLLEHLRPGTPLVALCHRDEDAAATEILADTIAAMQAAQAPIEGFPGVAQWGDSFGSYLGSRDLAIPRALVEEAADRYARLCAGQERVRLLHGDLHHDNVLLDSDRGWLAIDPKGVVGELAYELGAALRNPCASLDRFATPRAIERRITRFEARLEVDPGRVLGWAFAQAVLAAVWEAEDGPEGARESPFLRLAASLRPLLE